MVVVDAKVRGSTWSNRRPTATPPAPTVCNDLGFYNSLDSTLPPKRPFQLDALAQLVVESFWSYPSEKLDALFDTKMRVTKCIVEAEGDNNFKLPRKRVRE